MNPFYLTPEEIAELEKLMDIKDSDYGMDFGFWDGTDSPATTRCFHDWKEDKYFSANVYYTCKHCGQKKEEL